MNPQPGQIVRACASPGETDRLLLAIRNPTDDRSPLLIALTPAPASDEAVSIGAGDLVSGSIPRTLYANPGAIASPNEIAGVEPVAEISTPKLAALYRALVLLYGREYSRLSHRANLHGQHPDRGGFNRETDTVPYAGRVFDSAEIEAALGSVLDFWLTLGAEGERFEKSLATALGVRRSVLVNSGSSANLVALSALTSHRLGSDRLRRGDEVITTAAGFPTTVAPIIQNGLAPVFIDTDPSTLNADVSQLEAALRPGRTRAVMMAHTLGNPFNLRAVLDFCQRHGLWLIEDNCDALGCAYTLPAGMLAELGLAQVQARNNRSTNPAEITLPTGAWGHLSTQSFYPPHHITMGEGGAVNIIRDPRLIKLVESFRDWGRDCWCASGRDNTCGKRFGWALGELPQGYDHKYIYAHLGYNLKPLDLQAAIGLRQLDKLPSFVQARKDNWTRLRHGLDDLAEFFEFVLPTHATGWSPDGFAWDDSGCRSDCSWFGFALRVRPSAPFTRVDLARALDAARIGNRMLFGGNLIRQPAFVQLAEECPDAFRVVGGVSGADTIMSSVLFVGVYPGLANAMMDHVVDSIRDFVKAR